MLPPEHWYFTPPDCAVRSQDFGAFVLYQASTVDTDSAVARTRGNAHGDSRRRHVVHVAAVRIHRQLSVELEGRCGRANQHTSGGKCKAAHVVHDTLQIAFVGVSLPCG